MELEMEAVDYVTPPPQGLSPPPPAVALVLDVTAESAELEALKNAVLQVDLSLKTSSDARRY